MPESTIKNRRIILASIHDVSPKFEREIDILIDALDRRLDSPTFSMLVVPNHWGNAPIRPGTPFASKLRAWSDAGAEIFLHGWAHIDDCEHSGLARLRAKKMTAGEGEFLGLTRNEAAHRMARGRELLEDICGAPVAGFIAPAWLYGPGALEALKESDFPLVEDHMRVWQPQTGKQLAQGPVITWASRSRLRTASSLAFAGLAGLALRGQRVVRLAVHPGDTTKQSIMHSIDRTLARLCANRSAATYRSLLQE